MMNTREIAAEYRLEHWTRIMQERTQSGLSVKAFCKQIGICGNTYFYWQRKLREAACKVLPDKTLGMTKPQNEIATKSKSVVPSGWVVCESTESKEKTLSIEIGGCRVNVSEDVDPHLLSKVCKVLVEL